MKIRNIGQKIYTSAKAKVHKAFEPQKPKVTGLLPDAWKKSPTTGLTQNQLIDLILRNLV